MSLQGFLTLFHQGNGFWLLFAAWSSQLPLNSQGHAAAGSPHFSLLKCFSVLFDFQHWLGAEFLGIQSTPLFIPPPPLTTSVQLFQVHQTAWFACNELPDLPWLCGKHGALHNQHVSVWKIHVLIQLLKQKAKKCKLMPIPAPIVMFNQMHYSLLSVSHPGLVQYFGKRRRL